MKCISSLVIYIVLYFHSQTAGIPVEPPWHLGQYLDNTEPTYESRSSDDVGTVTTDDNSSHGKNVSVGSTKIRKVIEFAYMRGGSSLIGQIFNHLPQTSFWYEPLDAFYTSFAGTHQWSIPFDLTQTLGGNDRDLPYMEKVALKEFVANMFNCNFEKLPIDLLVPPYGIHGKMNWAHSWFNCLKSNSVSNAYSCTEPIGIDVCSALNAKTFRYNCPRIIDVVEKSRHQNNPQLLDELSWVDENTLKLFQRRSECRESMKRRMKECIQPFIDVCQRTKIRSAKFLRLRMSTMSSLLSKDPSFLVIHIVRDPRAIMVSRIKVNLLSKNLDRFIEKEAIILCKQMVEDYRKRKVLEKIYPGNFIQVKYEDLTADPHRTIVDFTRHLSIPDVELIESRMNVLLFAQDLKHVDDFEQFRANATATSLAWRRTITPQLKEKMDRDAYCQKVYTIFGYAN